MLIGLVFQSRLIVEVEDIFRNLHGRDRVPVCELEVYSFVKLRSSFTILFVDFQVVDSTIEHVSNSIRTYSNTFTNPVLEHFDPNIRT